MSTFYRCWNARKAISCAAGLLGPFCLVTGVAQGQTATSESVSKEAAADGSLTFHGVTLYGDIDLGVQYDTHGATISDYFAPGSNAIIQKNSLHSIVGVTPSNLKQSNIGLRGLEPLGLGDWSGIFKLETFFNPQSGNLSDGLKSMTLNNGRALKQQTVNADSSVAGQAFQAAYGGFSSPTYGTITFGRQTTLLADGIAEYDPNGASMAFSVIGWSGFAAGGGATEDRRLDQSVKYIGKFGLLHIGALYQFNGADGAAKTGWQAQLGAELRHASVDAYVTKKRDAISASALSQSQVNQLPALGYSSSNSLAATVSDNTSYSLMASYSFGAVSASAGYEYVALKSPSTPLDPGSLTIGGYVLAFVNNTAYAAHQRDQQVYWGGLKYLVTPQLELTGAYYGYHQNSFGTGTLAGCSDARSAACSGNLHAASLRLVYHFTKRFDAYGGSMWTDVQNGLASDYTNKSMIATTVGILFKF